VAITPLAGYVVTGFNSAGEPNLSKVTDVMGFFYLSRIATMLASTLTN